MLEGHPKRDESHLSPGTKRELWMAFPADLVPQDKRLLPRPPDRIHVSLARPRTSPLVSPDDEPDLWGFSPVAVGGDYRNPSVGQELNKCRILVQSDPLLRRSCIFHFEVVQVPFVDIEPGSLIVGCFSVWIQRTSDVGISVC